MKPRLNFHHAALSVTDIDEGVRWYEKNLQAKVAYKDNTWALLEVGDIALALVLPDQHPPHLAFERRDAETFGELSLHRDGTASVYVQDPFGNTVEFLIPNEK